MLSDNIDVERTIINRKNDKKMIMIIALIGVGALGYIAAKVISGYSLEAVGVGA